MKKIILLLYCCALYLNSTAQKQLFPNQYCPDIIVSVNHQNKILKQPLSEWYKKPLLLHYWAISCTDAVESLQLLNEWYQKYKNQINIIAVTQQPFEQVQPLFKQLPFLKNFNVPMVYADTALRQWFPHKIVPHNILINTNGKIIAITKFAKIDSIQLNNFIQNLPVNMPYESEILNNDEYYSVHPMMITDYAKNKSQMLSYSYISGFRKGYASINYPPALKDSMVHIKIVNQPLKQLFMYTLKNNKFHKTCIDGDSVLPSGLFAYDLMLKSNDIAKALQHMKYDLIKYFNITVENIQKDKKVYVLKWTGEGKPPKSNFQRAFNEKMGDTIHCRNQTIQNLIDLVLYKYDEYIINETGNNIKTDIYLPASINISLLKEWLNKQGYSLQEEIRSVSTLKFKKVNTE